MPECGVTLDQVKNLQYPFILEDDDLFLVSHKGTGKVITGLQLKEFCKNSLKSYIYELITDIVNDNTRRINTIEDLLHAIKIRIR